jgi:hypothetical protein
LAVELLAIVQAEQAAEALVNDAQEQKEAMIKEAYRQQVLQLAAVIAPQPVVPQLHQQHPRLDLLKETAKRNKAKAVKRILEELYAS